MCQDYVGSSPRGSRHHATSSPPVRRLGSGSGPWDPSFVRYWLVSPSPIYFRRANFTCVFTRINSTGDLFGRTRDLDMGHTIVDTSIRDSRGVQGPRVACYTFAGLCPHPRHKLKPHLQTRTRRQDVIQSKIQSNKKHSLGEAGAAVLCRRRPCIYRCR